MVLLSFKKCSQHIILEATANKVPDITMVLLNTIVNLVGGTVYHVFLQVFAILILLFFLSGSFVHTELNHIQARGEKKAVAGMCKYLLGAWSSYLLAVFIFLTVTLKKTKC